MMIQTKIREISLNILNGIVLPGTDAPKPEDILINKTPAEFTGHLTLVLFPFIKRCGKSPEMLGNLLGSGLKEQIGEIQSFNIVKGFLNLELSAGYWQNYFYTFSKLPNLGLPTPDENSETVLIEYPSPNTNKPLHLGHLRNIFLGSSLIEIFKANGKQVIPVCLFNDRGTNISKSMVAWQLYANGATPSSTGMKGDKFVGDYYVRYSDEYKKQVQTLIDSGMPEEQAKKEAELDKEVNRMLIEWENGNAEIRSLWKTMNDWVYSGFDQTFHRLGIRFEKYYHESDVYNLGKETVREGLIKGVFTTREDGSVWIDMKDKGLDEKVILRSNGTSIYITQDIAVAYLKQKDFKYQRSIYVVGNEQDHHFKVLFEILSRLGMQAADKLYHLSYGMVELPTGKMKSREGTVVDADDLLDEMVETAGKISEELGKLEGKTEVEKQHLFETIGIGALRYFILKVDPKKRMIFNPQESVDMHGHTAPFIQYTHARICSILRKAGEQSETNGSYTASEKEIGMIALLSEFPIVVAQAEQEYNPSVVANYIYELAKGFNQFYHDYPIATETDAAARAFRINLTAYCGAVIKRGLGLLCIGAPEKM